MKRGRSNWTTKRVVQLAVLATAGVTVPDIASIMGLTQQAVRDAARRFSIPLPRRSATACDATKVVMAIWVPAESLEGLGEAADARGIAVPDLIARMAATAGREGAGFIANVLDDGRVG